MRYKELFVDVTKLAKKVSSGYTEDWLPLRGIQNGMIITATNEKVTGAMSKQRPASMMFPRIMSVTPRR